MAKGDSLPDGAAQFKRLLSLKSDLPAVIKRVTEGGAEGSETPIDKKEWDALSDFMRKVYKGGDDMKSYIKGGAMYDPEKKKKAEEQPPPEHSNNEVADRALASAMAHLSPIEDEN